MNFNEHLLARSARNLGVRVVGTSQDSQGYSSTLLPIAASRTYTNVLPALNLVWSLSDSFLMRFAAFAVICRGRI